MQLAPGDSFDRYTIEALIGQGGMGHVYRGYDVRLRRRIALKILRVEGLSDASMAVRCVLREARAAAALDHPGSVAIFDVGELSGVPFIAMEHVVGRSLRSYVGDATVPIAERLRWLREIARVLAAAHGVGLVHRDIKPENVMVRADGTVKVLDFGIARRLPIADDDADPESRGPSSRVRIDPFAATFEESTVAGTPGYMAPEQVQGRAIDARADQFAWGVLAYELLHGALPWKSAHEGVTMMVAVVTERPEPLSPLSGIAPHVANAVDRALEKDPDRRFSAMTDLLAALEPAGSRAGRRRGQPVGPSFASDGTLFVGREAELATLREHIAGGKRLVTILGPPGVGKTRLARVAAARDLVPLFEGRVWFVDLSEAESLADVVHATARALGASLSIDVSAQATVEPLAAMLGGPSRAAVVLDGLDRIAARHGAALEKLLDLAPRVCLLVTSRERLRLRAEHIVEVGPLATPTEGDEADAIASSEAISLFVDRARAARPGYQVDAAELVRVGAVVRLLDGLPLGIELAAARMTLLGAQGLLDRLARRAEVLQSGGGRGAGSTGVEAAIDASWALLGPAERSALSQCSVFRGGFDLEAAEAVIDLDAADVLEVLERLRDRSLLAAREPGASGKPRFFLYLPIRDFAAGKLDETSRRVAWHRHASWYAMRVRVWVDALGETGSAAALAMLTLERDNLRAIPERLGPGEEDANLLHSALLALDPLAHAEGSIEEHLHALDRALGAATGSPELRATLEIARARALVALGSARDAIHVLKGATSPEAILVEAGAHAALGATERARERAADARSSATRAGQPLFAARADAVLAALAWGEGGLTEAEGLYQRARVGLRSVGARADEGRAALDLALVRAALGATEEASRIVTDAIGLLADAADPRLPAAARSAFGGLALDLGRVAEARAACEEALAQQQRLADRAGEAATRWRLACLFLDEGDADRAEIEALAALERAPTAGADRLRARVLGVLALAVWERGHADAAGAHARQAIASARAAGDRLGEGLFGTLLGAFEASAGRSTEASAAFDEARRAHWGASGPIDAEIAVLAEAWGDARRARDLPPRSTKKAEESRFQGRLRLTRVLSPAWSGPVPFVRRSFLVRALARRLQAVLPPQDRSQAWSDALDPHRRALVVDVASRAFLLPGATPSAWIDLSAKRSLFRLLVALAAHHHAGGGWVSASALAEAIWTGEDLTTDEAARRVQAEVATLQAMGLRKLIETGPDGARLDPDLTTIEVPGKM